jgi:hypothetical protein
MRLAEHVASMGYMTNTYKIFVRKHGGKRSKVTVEMDLKELGCEGVDRFHLAQIWSSDGLL